MRSKEVKALALSSLENIKDFASVQAAKDVLVIKEMAKEAADKEYENY